VGTHMWLLEQSACTTLKALGAAHMRGTKCLESAANRLLVEAIMYICLLSLKHKLHALADMMICIAFFVSFLLYRQQLRLVISIARHASASTLSGAQNFKILSDILPMDTSPAYQWSSWSRCICSVPCSFRDAATTDNILAVASFVDKTLHVLHRRKSAVKGTMLAKDRDLLAPSF